MKALTVWILLMVVCLGVVPIGLSLGYQFGPTYNQKVYPLDQAKVYINTAQSAAVPTASSPHVVSYYTLLAWADVNKSQSASGVGNGSTCWLWPKPDQTYGYVDGLFVQTLDVTANYTAGGLFNGTVFITWANLVVNLLGNAGNAITGGGPGGDASIGGCLFWGNEFSVLGTIAIIVAVVGGSLLIPSVLLYKEERERKRKQKAGNKARAARNEWLAAHPGNRYPHDVGDNGSYEFFKDPVTGEQFCAVENQRYY
jgi:hypothetical protein